jgi:hypothetical protein
MFCEGYMSEKPHYFGKRMRDLLRGAAIGIIPYPPKDDHFGTMDEQLGSKRRFLFLGYKQAQSSNLRWSLYGFSPQYGAFDYGFKLSAVQRYNEICIDGKISDSDYAKHEKVIAEASKIPTRNNGMLWAFSVEDETEIIELEAKAKSEMMVDSDLVKRADVAELIKTVCCTDKLPKPSALNFWGDYKFLWHDFGFFIDHKYLCVFGVEKVSSYYAMSMYARNTPNLETIKG